MRYKNKMSEEFETINVENEENNDYILYIVRGVSGSGKGTIAELLAPGHHYEANQYFIKNGSFTYNPAKISEAHEYCRQCVQRDLELGIKKISVCNTFVHKTEFQVYLDMAAKLGYKVCEIIVKGDYNSRLHIPSSKIDRMIKEFEYK